MMHLTPLVFTILLASMVTTSMVSYLPVTNRIADMTLRQVGKGLEEFETAAKAYKADNVVYAWVEDCPGGFSPGDPECTWDRTVSDDGSVDTADWEAQLITGDPSYLYRPALPSGWSWTMGTDTNGVYACINAQHDDITRRVFNYMIRYYSSDRMKIGSSCAPAVAFTMADVEAHPDGPIYLTYWLHK